MFNASSCEGPYATEASKKVFEPVPETCDGAPSVMKITNVGSPSAAVNPLLPLNKLSTLFNASS